MSTLSPTRAYPGCLNLLKASRRFVASSWSAVPMTLKYSASTLRSFSSSASHTLTSWSKLTANWSCKLVTRFGDTHMNRLCNRSMALCEAPPCCSCSAVIICRVFICCDLQYRSIPAAVVIPCLSTSSVLILFFCICSWLTAAAFKRVRKMGVSWQSSCSCESAEKLVKLAAFDNLKWDVLFLVHSDEHSLFMSSTRLAKTAALTSVNFAASVAASFMLVIHSASTTGVHSVETSFLEDTPERVWRTKTCNIKESEKPYILVHQHWNNNLY